MKVFGKMVTNFEKYWTFCEGFFRKWSLSLLLTPKKEGKILKVLWRKSWHVQTKYFIFCEGFCQKRRYRAENIEHFVKEKKEQVTFSRKYWIFCEGNGKKRDIKTKILNVLWRKFEKKAEFLKKYWTFCEGNSKKSLNFWKNIECFVKEIRKKAWLFAKILNVLRRVLTREVTIGASYYTRSSGPVGPPLRG